jgi:Flp pilus assembly pilin Flp
MSSRTRSMREESGAGLVEYAMLVALIAIVLMGAVKFLGSSTSDAFTSAGGAFAEKPEVTLTAAGIDGELEATFESAGDTISLGDVDAEGWTYEVKKDTGRRVVVRFKETGTKKVVTVTGWLNKKDKVKTKVKVNRS